MITTSDQDRRIEDRSIELGAARVHVAAIGPRGAQAILARYYNGDGQELELERILPGGEPAAIAGKRPRPRWLLYAGKMTAIAAAIALLAPAAAGAQVDVAAAMHTARGYWQAQGVPLVCDPTWEVAELADPALAGYGSPLPSCSVQFDPVTASYGRSTFCRLALHEYGHALGLTHADVDRYPIMAGTQATYTVRTPWCDGAQKIGRLQGGGFARRRHRAGATLAKATRRPR